MKQGYGFKEAAKAVAALVLGGLAVSLMSPGLAGAGVLVDSETIARYFERDVGTAEDQSIIPIYEYLRIEAGALDDNGFSVRAYGWGRHNFGDDYWDDDTDGELLYANIRYQASDKGLWAALGRQYVFSTSANEAVDGLRVNFSPSQSFNIDLYGGLPVDMAEEQGRSGDSVYGGRLGYRHSSLFGLGASYKRLSNDGDLQEETAGLDGYLYVPGYFTLSGFSSYNVDEDGWRAHSYEARVPVAMLTIVPRFSMYNYDEYFDLGDTATASPFRFLVGSGEQLTTYGADVEAHLSAAFDAIVTYKRHDYDNRDDSADYFAGRLNYYGQGRTEAGAEAGRMEGGTDDTRYTLLRGDVFLDFSAFFLSGDLVYLHYDEDINGEDTSLYGSVAVGADMLDDKLRIKLSGDGSQDPYFDSDYRGLLSVRYLFEM